jgi:hypothetical protein
VDRPFSGSIADRARLLTVHSAGDAHAPVGGPPAMTADDQRYTLRQAADLTGKSIDTLRRRIKAGELPGAGKDPADPTGTWYIPASALIAAGLIAGEQFADGEPEAVIARRRAERERDADHDELLTLRAEKTALHREIELLREDVAHLRKVNAGLVASLGKGRAA